jgi:predicted Zn-dependent peptidase
LGVRTVAIDSDFRYPLSILAAIFGGGMSSRLFHEVREKRGLAYYVRTHSDYYQDCGTLVTMAGVDPKKATEAVSVIIDEYQKITKASNVSKEELTKAKEFLKGHLVLELEDSRSVAGFYAEQELLEKSLDNPDTVLAKIEKVTAEDIEEAAKKFLVKSTLNLAAIGNFEDGKELESLLKK